VLGIILGISFSNYKFIIVIYSFHKEATGPILWTKKILRSKISMHTSFSCLCKDELLLERPTPHVFEGVIDGLHEDWALKMHTYDFYKLTRGCDMHFPDLISALYDVSLTLHVLGCATLLHIFVLATMFIM
jgi:hypothetical protein